MKHNIGSVERVLRIVLGSALVVAGWVYLEGFGIGVASVLFVLSGTVLVLTGLFSYCPLNVLFGHNSCRHCREGITEKHMPL